MNKLVWTDIIDIKKDKDPPIVNLNNQIKVLIGEPIGRNKILVTYELMFKERPKSQILLFLIYLVKICGIDLNFFEIMDKKNNVLFFDEDFYNKKQYERIFKED
tara:strand:+ start:151 stop:462 length:312 start_codon:yes stop_codon:yes gene_type:complete